MVCPACEAPQPGPHGIMCRVEARDVAHKMTVETLLYGSVPWGEAPTRGTMVDRLNAFCERYAAACDVGEKAAKVLALAHPRLPWADS